MKRIIFAVVIGVISKCFALQIFNLHINGINTTKKQTEQNMFMLQEKSEISSNIVRWNYIYNPSSEDPSSTNLIANIEDTIKQKNAELTLDDYTDVYIKSFNLDTNVYYRGSVDYLNLQKSLSLLYTQSLYKGENFNTIISEFNDKTEHIFDSTTSLLTENNIDKDNTFVLLIPHSQGNLYANSLYEYLTDKDLINKENLLIFGIATPTNKIYSSDIYKNMCIIKEFTYESEGEIQRFPYQACGFFNYLTDYHDRVISDLVSFMYSDTPLKPLPTNNYNSNWGIFSLNHNLIDFYLSPSIDDINSSTYKIKEGIWLGLTYFINKLKSSSAYLSNSKYLAVQHKIIDKNSKNEAKILNSKNEVVCDYLACYNSIGYIQNSFLEIEPYEKTTYFYNKSNEQYTNITKIKPIEVPYKPSAISFVYFYQHVYDWIDVTYLEWQHSQSGYRCETKISYGDYSSEIYNISLSDQKLDIKLFNNEETCEYLHPTYKYNNEFMIKNIFSTKLTSNMLKQSFHQTNNILDAEMKILEKEKYN